PRPRAARPRAEAGGRRAGRTRAHRGDAFERSRGAGAARARAAGARAERLTMERRQLTELLTAVQRGECSIDAALARLRGMPFEDLGFARLDHHRALRNGFPEVILGEGKSPEQLIAIAGMEGALPSVVGGLVDRPVIAVPTSVGYGTSLGGLAALLGMLNTCAAGVVVVNIDNGFGAAAAATRINHPPPA